MKNALLASIWLGALVAGAAPAMALHSDALSGPLSGRSHLTAFVLR